MKKKIVFFIIILPFIFRAIFGLWIMPQAEFFELNAEQIEKKAIANGDAKNCYSIGSFSPPKFFWDFIFPTRVDKEIILPLLTYCVSSVAIAENNELLCDSLPDEPSYHKAHRYSLKNECYAEFARATGRTDVCELMGGQIKYEMKYECYQEAFITSENICQEIRRKEKRKISTEWMNEYKYSKNFKKKDDCLEKFAIEKEDPRFCKGIVSGGKRADCQRKFQTSSDERLISCKNLTYSKQKECIKDVAVNANDISLCLSLFGDKSVLYNINAFNIHSPGAAEKCCEEIIRKGKRSDPSSCEEEFNTELGKNTCLSEVAVNKNNHSMCKGPGYLCHLILAKKNNDPNICGALSNFYYKDYCFTDLALYMNNPEYCKLKETGISSCLYKIAVNNNNIDICLDINEKSSYRKDCLERLKNKH